MVQRDTCTPIFIASLFIIVRTLKQPKCPLTEQWIKKKKRFIKWASQVAEVLKTPPANARDAG